jgi:2-dehydropantoate 2-reductase
MRVLVMGAGALGGFFGARLQAAGHEVAFVARGAHLEAMGRGGLRVESPMGDLHLPQVLAVADPADAPRPDIVLLMVKNRDLEQAAEALRPVLGPETAVMTAQNGVSAPARLAGAIGPERVIAGAVYMPADIRAPGVIRHSAPNARLQAGVAPGGPATACDRLLAAVEAAGIPAEPAGDVDALLWEKFVLLAPFAAITALTRLDAGPIRGCPETRALWRQAVEEAVAVGHAACPGLPGGQTDRVDAMLDALPAGAHASMLDDLTRGKPLELEYLSGEIVRLGAAHGIPTPVHGMVRAALLPFVDGAP